MQSRCREIIIIIATLIDWSITCRPRPTLNVSTCGRVVLRVIIVIARNNKRSIIWIARSWWPVVVRYCDNY